MLTILSLEMKISRHPKSKIHIKYPSGGQAQTKPPMKICKKNPSYVWFRYNWEYGFHCSGWMKYIWGSQKMHIWRKKRRSRWATKSKLGRAQWEGFLEGCGSSSSCGSSIRRVAPAAARRYSGRQKTLPRSRQYSRWNRQYNCCTGQYHRAIQQDDALSFRWTPNLMASSVCSGDSSLDLQNPLSIPLLIKDEIWVCQPFSNCQFNFDI